MFADFPDPPYSISQRYLTSETCCGLKYGFGKQHALAATSRRVAITYIANKEFTSLPPLNLFSGQTNSKVTRGSRIQEHS